MPTLFEISESYEGGTLGGTLTTSNTIFQSVTVNGFGASVQFAAGRTGLGATKSNSTSGTAQLGYAMPGVTFSGTNPSTLADDPGGTVVVSTWCKVESGPLGAGTSVIYLEAANVNEWETEGSGRYSDFDAVVVQFAPLTWNGFVGEGGVTGTSGDTVYILQHGPGWVDYGGPAWDTFGYAPMGQWLKYEISYMLDNSSRVTVSNEAGDILIDTGWKAGPGGFRASSVWMRMRGTSGSSEVHFTQDDFSLRVESEEWPRSTDFQTFPENTVGVSSGDFVTFDNSIFDGIDFEFPGTGYEDYGAVFTDSEYHSPGLSITGAPITSGSGNYSELQFPYNHTPANTSDEVLTFWHKHVVGNDGESSNMLFYDCWGASVGSDRTWDWVNTVSLFTLGASKYEVWLGPAGDWDLTEVDVPAGEWVRIKIEYIFATSTYKVSGSDGKDTEYFSVSESMPDLGNPTPGAPGFGFHSLYPTRHTYRGQNWIDDVNYDPITSTTKYGVLKVRTDEGWRLAR